MDGRNGRRQNYIPPTSSGDNNLSLKPPVARKLDVRHTSFVCLTASFLAAGGFFKLLHIIPGFYQYYSGFFQFHDFSMHGTFLVIFQVFHDFQSLWEPCNEIPVQEIND